MPKAYSNALLFLRAPVNIASKLLNKAVLTGLAIIAASGRGSRLRAGRHAM
jgi:hypothetical protein